MEYNFVNAYYMQHIWRMGGTESHLFYLAKKYRNFVVLYVEAHPGQIERLSQYVDCIKVHPKDRFKIKNLFVCYNRDILRQCEAENVYLVLHLDYKDMYERKQTKDLPVDDRVDKYLGVSQHVCDAWEELTGIQAEFIGEPVVLEPVRHPLLLCSATRLTKEKGWERMKILAERLNEAGVNYMWHIYTNKTVKDPVRNMVIMKPRLDVTDWFGMYDAYVQLSDNEAFCLSVAESLLRGTPVIGTNLPVFHEIGLNESNSVLLDLDMKEIPIEKIVNIRDLKFEYTTPEDKWEQYLC